MLGAWGSWTMSSSEPGPVTTGCPSPRCPSLPFPQQGLGSCPSSTSSPLTSPSGACHGHRDCISSRCHPACLGFPSQLCCQAAPCILAKYINELMS